MSPSALSASAANATGGLFASRGARGNEDVVLDALVFALFVVALYSMAEVIRSLVAASPTRTPLLGQRMSRTNAYGSLAEPEIEASYEALLALSDSIGPARPGLTEEQIEVMPTYKYGSDETSPGGGPTREDTMCSICRDDMADGEIVLIMPCSCRFHKACISTWLAMNPSCPLCRCVLG